MSGRLFVIMGVAGCGKSSIGAAVCGQLGGVYIDGDDYHPQANIDKMASGEPLTDEDRWPWLKMVGQALSRIDGVGMVGCSALKKSYREYIQANVQEPITFIFLDGSRDLISARMAAREGHFMPTSLLDSQFAALERPDDSERCLRVDISGSRVSIVDNIIRRIAM